MSRPAVSLLVHVASPRNPSEFVTYEFWPETRLAQVRIEDRSGNVTIQRHNLDGLLDLLTQALKGPKT